MTEFIVQEISKRQMTHCHRAIYPRTIYTPTQHTQNVHRMGRFS